MVTVLSMASKFIIVRGIARKLLDEANLCSRRPLGLPPLSRELEWSWLTYSVIYRRNRARILSWFLFLQNSGCKYMILSRYLKEKKKWEWNTTRQNWLLFFIKILAIFMIDYFYKNVGRNWLNLVSVQPRNKRGCCGF